MMFHLVNYILCCVNFGTSKPVEIWRIPNPPPKYLHEDLHSTFSSLFTSLLKFLEGVSQSYHEVPFARVGDSFEIVLRPEWVDKSLVFGVREYLRSCGCMDQIHNN